jgi:hypothetical protein
MIIFEQRLGELVELLPSYADSNSNVFEIRYEWGTVDVLNKFLVMPENVSKYPLIWLVNGTDSHELREPRVTRNCRIIIATNSDKQDSFNDFIYKTDYETLLIPVMENLLQSFKQSGISILSNDNITTQYLPNYSINDNGKGMIYVWNAISLECELSFNNQQCINKIFFNNN